METYNITVRHYTSRRFCYASFDDFGSVWIVKKPEDITREEAVDVVQLMLEKTVLPEQITITVVEVEEEED